MDIRDLLDKQKCFDEEHGFPVEFSTQKERYDQVTKDLVGLLGEIGEFANIVKKINLSIDRPEYEFDVLSMQSVLKEELADCAIYLARISMILDIDLEHEVASKISANYQRFSKLKR